MADEPRRSGRATKGQHTKAFDEAEPSEPPRSKGKGKASKRAAKNVEQPADEGEDDDALIRCICGVKEDDEGGQMFIACDNCSAWQHNDCMGIGAVEDDIPYQCEQCSPDDHTEFYELRKSGLMPEQIATRRQEEADSRREEEAKARRQKKGKKGKSRQSAVSTKPEPSEDAPAAQLAQPMLEQMKRKHSEDAPTNANGDIQPTKHRKSSSHAPSNEINLSKKIPPALKIPNQIAPNITDLQPESRRKAAESLRATLVKSINEAANKRFYRIPDGETAGSLGEQFGILVEHFTFLTHCGKNPDYGGPYKHQFTSVRFNLGKNMELVLQLLNGVITPEALSRMSAAEMASEEQRRKDALLKEENDKQAMAIKDDQLRIRKTHKGEEIVISDHHVADSTPNSAAQPQYAERPGTNDGETGAHERSESAPYVGQPQQSPRASEPPSATSKTGFKIDRLLRLEGFQSPPFSPYEPTSSEVVWRGKVEMPFNRPGTSFFIARATHVAGADLGSPEAHAAIFPENLVMDGRIEPSLADKYLSSLSISQSTDVVVYRLDPTSDSADGNDEFVGLYDYLKVRKDRYGVVSHVPRQPHVSDLYLVPLAGGKSEWPTFLSMLVNNEVQKLPFERILLAVFVIRHKSSSISTKAGAYPPGAPPPSATTPTAPHGQGAIPVRPSPPTPIATQGSPAAPQFPEPSNTEQAPHQQ